MKVGDPDFQAFRLGPLALDQILEPFDIRRNKRVQTDPLAAQALDPNQPTLPADLDRNIERVMLRSDQRSDVVSWGISCLLMRVRNIGTVAPVARGAS